ncbi:MAG TPA: MFS transporter, partial [Paraburkholderia sp.]|nr:MFS transporter [Paraburkholderia sp.]
SWLSDADKRQLEAEVGVAAAHATSFRNVLRDRKIYVLAFAYFCIIASIYAISFWLPTLIKEQGVSDTLRLGWYAAIPYVAAGIAMYVAGRSSDRTGERRYHCAVPALTGALLLVASIFTQGNLFATLALLTAATAMMWMAYTVFWAMPGEYIKGPAAAGGIALINTIGLSGGFWGPAAIGWARTATGNSHLALVVMACMPVIAGLLILASRQGSKPAHDAAELTLSPESN